MSGSSTATYPVGTIAKLLVLTERQVQSLATQGVLPKSERGRYELVPVVQAYIRYLRERTVTADAGRDDVATLKARIIKAKTRLAEAEADQLDGSLLPRIAVEAAWGKIITNMRARLLALPSKCAPAAHQAASLSEVAAVITAAVHEALDEISRTAVYAESDVARARGAGEDSDGSTPAGSTAAESNSLGVG